MTIFWIHTAIILCTIPSVIQGIGYLIDRDLITKKDGFKFNFHSGSGIVREKGFRSLGCWKDTWTRAIEVLEKKHELLMDKNYKLREDPLRKCAIAALDKKMKLFAIENGGQCLGGVSITSAYKKYGAAQHCKEDGYGGPWSMHVYGFTGRKHRDGGYSEWSRWTKCSAACGKGTRRRFRTCTHPSPTLGGRDCIRLGLGMDTKTCETECLGTENDELENPRKMHNSQNSSAKKKSDDTDDYFDDNDDDVDDDDLDDDDDDNHDKTADNSKDQTDKSSDGKNGNKLDENDSETRPSHESTDLAREGKNTNAQLLKPAVKMFEDQGKTIDGNQNTKASLPSLSIAEENMDKIKSLSKGTLDIQPGSINKNNNLGNDGSNDDKSRQDSRLSPLPHTNSAATGNALKKPVSGLSQGTTDVQLGSTNENKDHSNGVSDSDKSGRENGVLPLPQTSSTSSGVGGKIKQFSSSENTGDKTHQNVNNDAESDTMENHLSDISSTQASESNADMKEPGHNTVDTELDDPEENTVPSTSDARISDKEITGNVPSEKESSRDNNKDIASNEKEEDVDDDSNDTPLSGGTSTTKDDVSNNETSGNSLNVQEPSQSSENTDAGNIGENPDDNASDSQSNDEKSVTENKANSDNEASMKEQNLAVGNSHSRAATSASDETFRAKNNLPNKQQMKAAQDLLRSRWLSLAKSGRLKSTPTAHSGVKTLKSSKPVVDVSLKDDSAEDFEDQEMEDDDDGEVDEDKVKGKQTDDEEVTGQATNGWKEEEQDKKPEETQMDDKIDDKITEGHTQEEQNENIQTNGKDNKATYGDTTDEQTTNEDSASDDTMNAPEMDLHEEPLGGHKENEMKDFEGQVNGGVMNDKISQEGGAKRVKEECICPKVVCIHLADTGMFIDNTNVTDINDLTEMKAFAKGLAIGFKTEDKDVQMGIIANGQRSHIHNIHRNHALASHGWNLIIQPQNKHANQARNVIELSKSRPGFQERDLIAHPRSRLYQEQNPITPASQLYSKARRRYRRAEAYLLLKQKMPIPPVLNDVLFVLISGAESDIEVHAPVKEMKSAGAKIVVIGVGKDAKIGKLGSQADLMFMVPPGAGNAIVNAIVVAICKTYLMGKPGPNVKPCPCMLQPSKKTAAEKIDKANTQMTREEYKSGMFHASGLPKEVTSSKTSPQPSSISKIPGATLTTTSSTSPAKKPITVMPKTKPSGGNSPAHAISPTKTGASQPASLSAPDKTSTANQNVMALSQPATQSKPAITPVTIGATQATPAKPNAKVIHIKHDKLKPLSKTLSVLGKSLHQAHDKGELKEGKYTVDIHNLLKTIGKLKSQVDSLRNDQAQLGSNDALGSTQLGTVSKVPGQSQDTGKSNNQSSPSIPLTSQSTQSSGNTDQLQSSPGNESGPSKGLGSKSESGGQIPLKLRIVDKMANKQQKNTTTLHLELSDKFEPAQNVGEPLFRFPSLGTAGNSSVFQNTSAQSTTSIPSTNNIRTGDDSLSSTTSVANKAAPKLKLPLQTKVAQQTTLPSEDVKIIPTTSSKQPQPNTTSKQPQQDNGNTGVNGDAQNTKPSNVAAGNMLKTSKLSAKPQSLNQAQTATTNAKQTTNALGNAKPNPPLTTTPKVVKTPPSELATNAATTTTVQDTKPTKPNPQTNTSPQQTDIQKVKPIPSKPTSNVKAPQSNMQSPTESTVVPQKPLPSKTSSQSVVTNDQAKLLQSNTITQQSLHQNNIQNAAGQFASTNPSTAAGNQRQKPTQKTKDFAAIESQLAKIVQTQEATEKSTIPDCNINLGFVLDGSASVEGTKRGNFLKMINFVKDMIHEFVVLSQQVHVGTLVYSTNSSVILSFGTKGTEKVIDQILDSIHYPGQGSLTGKAIKDSWNQMFSAVPRGRKSKLVLLTDGPSNDDVKVPSKWIRDNGVEMFVIGLGKGYDETQLRDMASLPSNKHIMYKDYDGLSASVQEVRNKICGFSPEEVLQIMTSARVSDNSKEVNAFQRSFGRNQCILDVVFLLDGSRQVETNGGGNFQREINFVKKAANYLPLSPNDVHIGVGLLGDSNVMVFPMNKHYTQNTLAYELDHIRYPASSDIQPQEIEYARQIMLMKGVRDVAPRVFVLVTDVSSLDSYRRAINELRTDGSDVAMFGVGSELYKQEVKVRPSVPGLVDQIVTLDNADETEAAKRFAINMCKLSNSKRTEIPRLHWKASGKVLNKN